MYRVAGGRQANFAFSLIFDHELFDHEYQREYTILSGFRVFHSLCYCTMGKEGETDAI